MILEEGLKIAGFAYFFIINIVAFLIMGLDKQRARKNEWRIKEKTLFTIAILGGSIGSILGMQIFRHKTKHSIFLYGMPAILLFQILLLVWQVL